MIITPTLRQLRYLVALLDHRHFGKAAEACLVTQPTLSAGLRELEDLLGVRLIERTNRKVLPTALGEAIGARARDILLRATDLVEAARASEEPLAGPLRLGVIPTIGPFVLPRVLPPLRAAYPELRLTLREDRSAQLVADLRDGLLDAVLLALPYDIGSLSRAVVAEDRFLVALPKGHPLADRPALAAADLPARDLLLLGEGHCLRDHALAACHLGGAGGAFAGSSLYTLVQMVAGGQGITFLPRLALGSDTLAGADIALVPLDEPPPHRRIALVWREAFPRAGDMERLAAALRERLCD